MSESNVKTPEGMHTITPHIVVSDAAGAADWGLAQHLRTVPRQEIAEAAAAMFD